VFEVFHYKLNSPFTVPYAKNIKIEMQRIIILLVVLYGCETWSLTLGEECRLRMFENRVLRRIFGPVREHHDLYSSPNIMPVSKPRRLSGACGTYRRQERCT
jgi:hypothetical protein